MKKLGILNRELAGIFARIGHTDRIMIADCGLPIPDGVTCIDLSYKIGEPGFMAILETVLADYNSEKAIIATEMSAENESLYKEVHELIRTPFEEVSHEQLKQLSKEAKVIIRTGEATPYANILLQSGVIF
ncbi:D-ribose pyranase [Kurthia senegalensis]|uniref:D-ribose pyranase n=1 Tax=Kurthia senegalensis TaxID=1033740 RepID=UPI00028859D1|nr:D-ribose pyranase [Kurthia senegalensis]